MPLTPEGLFDQIWEAVLVRDDFEQSLQDWRAMRLEARPSPKTRT